MIAGCQNFCLPYSCQQNLKNEGIEMIGLSKLEKVVLDHNSLPLWMFTTLVDVYYPCGCLLPLWMFTTLVDV